MLEFVTVMIRETGDEPLTRFAVIQALEIRSRKREYQIVRQTKYVKNVVRGDLGFWVDDE